MNFNKLCEFEDFADPEMVEIIRDVCAHKANHFPERYPAGFEARKDWEVAMSVRALRHFGVLGPDAVILGVAAGTEDTIFYLTRHARQVFVTDRYLGAGYWSNLAPITMLVEPGFLAPFDFDPNRLVVQHMDGRSLRYPDETFDAVFSSGSIEHFGELLDVAHAAYEMGRVLKPGGILVLSTEFRISGPPGGIGWPGETLLLSAEDLQRHIVEASGLEPVDEMQTVLSEATLASTRDMYRAVTDHQRRLAGVSGRSVPEYAHWDFPHILLSHSGYVFGSVHLTLQRPQVWPAVENEWARPPKETLDSITAWNAEILASGDPASAPVPELPPVPDTPPAPINAVPALVPVLVPAVDGSWDAWVSSVTTLSEVATDYRQAACAHLGGVLGLGEQAQHQLEGIARDTMEANRHLAATAAVRAEVTHRPERTSFEDHLLVPPGSPPDRSRWKSCRANLGGDQMVMLVVDASSDDPISTALANGEPALYRPLVDLMLTLTGPGDLVVDLGAHIGTFTLAAAGAGRRAIAVEASPANAALLRASVAANHFWGVRVVNAAVGDSPGTVEFGSRGPWGRLVLPDDEVESEQVLAVTVDELLTEFGLTHSRFVKVDVEGCEVATVRGMRRLLEPDDAPPVLYESNGHTLGLFGDTPEGLLAAFDDLGYTSYHVDPPRLVRIERGRVQPETLVDCLALKQRPANLPGWVFAPPFTPDERVQRMVADCATPNPDHRAYMARRLQHADPEVLSHPGLSTTLVSLADDANEVVRQAAAWIRSR